MYLFQLMSSLEELLTTSLGKTKIVNLYYLNQQSVAIFFIGFLITVVITLTNVLICILIDAINKVCNFS